LPKEANQEKTGRNFQFLASIETARSFGKTLGILSVNPPPVI